MFVRTIVAIRVRVRGRRCGLCLLSLETGAVASAGSPVVRFGGLVSEGYDGRGAIGDRLRFPPDGLVGRVRERAVIDLRLEQSLHGESGALVFRGDAGRGKTALLGYAAAHGFAMQMTVLRASGVQGESELAFAGLHSLLHPIVDQLGGLPAPQRSALAAALGQAPAVGADRFLVSAGVLSLVAAAAEQRPVLCLVDDAQWLDVASADALVFAARRLGAEGVVMLFGARDDDVRGFESPGLDELVLAALDRESAVVLLERVSPGIAGSTRERLLAEAAGNPLALLELPAALSEAQLAGSVALPDALRLNARLRAAFMQRVLRLSESAQAVLLIAAADDGGDVLVVRRVAAALGVPDDALESAQASGLIELDGATLRFRHPLVRAAVYESATVSRRRRAHSSLADALAGDEHEDRRVWHRAMAAVSADEGIAGELENSARRSALRGGHASAASAFERAAKLSIGDSSRARRLAAAADTAWGAGQADRARGLLSLALPIADRPRRARLLYLSGVIEGRTGRLPDAVATLHNAIAVSDDASLTLEMLREACDLAMNAGDAGGYAAAGALAGRAGELVPATEIDRFTAATLTALSAELSGDFGAGAILSAEAIERAERLDDPSALIWAALTAGREGILGDGLLHATRAVQIARERSLVTVLPYALQVQGAQLIGQSQFHLASLAADEGRGLALEFGQPWAASWNLANLVLIDAVRGQEDRARARADELQALVARSGAMFVNSYVGRALGLLDLSLGRPGEALERLLVPVASIPLRSSPLLVSSLPDAVEAAVRSGRLDQVSVHLDRFRDWVGQFPNPARRALLARCLALVETCDPEPHFATALELASAVSPFDRARTELLYGEWLRRERRRVEARPHLRNAVELFGQLDVSPWEERARVELRASGATARKRNPSTRDQLTPQELQISHLVADGMTNSEIAARLFLSPRTIDYHLRKVFTKLDIASRTDLARIDLGEIMSF